MKKTYYRSIRSTLKRVRKEKGYTQKKLAEKLHVSAQIISDYETGKVLPSLAYLIDFCMELQVGPLEMRESSVYTTVISKDEKEVLLLLRECPSWITSVTKEICIFFRNYEKNRSN